LTATRPSGKVLHERANTTFQEACPVGQKTVKFSDLSGELIITGDALARIVIHEHPALSGGPVEIEALADEASAIEKAALRVAVVDVHVHGEPEPRRVIMGVDEFDKLAADRTMTEVLRTARPARRSRAAARAAGVRLRTAVA
jgi:hypothetical protein